MAHMNLTLEVIEECSAYSDGELIGWASLLDRMAGEVASSGCAERVAELSAMADGVRLVLAARGAL